MNSKIAQHQFGKMAGSVQKSSAVLRLIISTKFGFCVSISATEIEKSYTHIVTSADKTNKPGKFLWLNVGSDDFLYKGSTEFMDYLSTKKVNYKKYISDGGHTWMNVKKYLAETLPLLFK